MIPIATSHGEGRVQYFHDGDMNTLIDSRSVTIRYVDNFGQPAIRYPDNPNGSESGLAGFCSEDGRSTIMMPHPERVFRKLQMSWHPKNWKESRERSSIRILCDTKDLPIYVDNQLVGKTPLEYAVDVLPGCHQVG